MLKEFSISRNHLHFIVIIISVFALAALYYIYYYTGIDEYGSWRDWFWYLEIFEFRNDLHGSLFYPLFAYSIYFFWCRGILITWMLSMVLMMYHIVDYSPDTSSLLSNIFFLMLPTAIILFITLEAKWRNRERSHAQEREAERRTHMYQIFRAQENERKHIAQELHDDTTQSLLAIANQVQEIVDDNIVIEHPYLRIGAEKVRDAIVDISNDMRRLSLDLRPAILDNLGLIPALRWLVNKLEKETTIDVSFNILGNIWKLPPDKDVVVFRIVQESLNNIRRHSKATKAAVTIEFANDSLRLEISDNGKGFVVLQNLSKLPMTGSLGLIGMQERAHLLNGVMQIHSELNQGTSIVIKAKPHLI